HRYARASYKPTSPPSTANRRHSPPDTLTDHREPSNHSGVDGGGNRGQHVHNDLRPRLLVSSNGKSAPATRTHPALTHNSEQPADRTSVLINTRNKRKTP